MKKVLFLKMGNIKGNLSRLVNRVVTVNLSQWRNNLKYI